MFLGKICIATFAHERVGHMVMYCPRYFMGSTLTACFAIVIKYLGKNMTMCLIILCAKEAIYMRQNSILIVYINVFQRKQFT